MSVSNNNTTQEKSQAPPRVQGKNFTVLLYPDDPTHPQALAKIMKKWDYCYILHDKDTIIDDIDEELEQNEKKAHYHVVIMLPSERTVNGLAKELGIEQRFIRKVTSLKAMLLYLVHTGLYEKYQYKPNEVHGNRISIFLEAYRSIETDTEKLLKVIDIIQNRNCTEFSYTMKLLAFEGYTKFALKHYNLIRDIVQDNYARTRLNSINSIQDLKTYSQIQYEMGQLDFEKDSKI